MEENTKQTYMEQVFLIQYYEPKKITLESGKGMEGLYFCPITILWNNFSEETDFLSIH